MVDPKGIEPSTLRMRTVRSPRLSYGPMYEIIVMRTACPAKNQYIFSTNLMGYANRAGASELRAVAWGS